MYEIEKHLTVEKHMLFSLFVIDAVIVFIVFVFVCVVRGEFDRRYILIGDLF
jgi:hypothetical protein